MAGQENYMHITVKLCAAFRRNRFKIAAAGMAVGGVPPLQELVHC